MLQNERTLKQKISDLEAELAASRSRNKQLENELELARSQPVESKLDVITIENVQTVESGPPDGFGFDSEELEQANQDKMVLNQKVSELCPQET